MSDFKRQTKTTLQKMMMPRTFFLLVSVLGQLVILIAVISRFNEYFALFYAFSLVLSLVAFLWVVNSRINPAYKIAWIIPIMLFPIFGGLFYLFLGRSKMSRQKAAKMKAHEAKVKEAMKAHEPETRRCLQVMEAHHVEAAVQSRYIADYGGYPPYEKVAGEYLSIGELKFQRLLSELKKAERFIFMEYFIIEEGVMWNQILEVLKEKAAQGVDVRLIYDDMGCLFTLPRDYHSQLESMGIQCGVFNPLIPVLSLRMNHRDHRKITVIDGHTGFTGGINLADEYINEIVKYGHWKDTGIIIKGPAVWNLTVMFLAMWDYLKGLEEDYFQFHPSAHHHHNHNETGVADITDRPGSGADDLPETGFVQPFADSPLDDEPVSETVYLNMIYKAKKSVYITTPYLIIANEMVTALCAAAKGGVDVRIITPHKWDKWYVHVVTRTYYRVLVESGVKIYEYTPGFMHAKTFVVDDLYGVVGTINMDYRSLYLHFECGVWLYHTPSVKELTHDFLDTLKVCHQVTMKDFQQVRWYTTLLGSVLRVFAPML
ncbi:cardiolipin synthase [Anoxynatronum sibiricum]